MFKDGDLVVEINSGLTHRFYRYNDFALGDYDCVVYDSEYNYVEQIIFCLYKSSINFWFFNKRHVLIEKTRKIKLLE